MATSIITLTPSLDAPSYEGDVFTNGYGYIRWPNGDVTRGHRYSEYLQILRDHFPEVISEREPCPTCGR